MGHTRLGRLPYSRKWKAVVAALADPDVAPNRQILHEDVGQVAAKALLAAHVGLDRAVNDVGLRYTVYLLTQLVLSARQDDWRERLSDIGIGISKDISLFGVTAEVQNAIDNYISSHGRVTDVSEMAQQAVGEAITSLAAAKAQTLFGSGEEEVKSALRELSTKKGFADLGQRFFGRFVARFLNFYLSRVTAAQLGGARLQQVGDLSKFNEILNTHCEQAARIVRDFCGEWYSKTEYVEGIDLENTGGFVAVALNKLRDELQLQGARND